MGLFDQKLKYEKRDRGSLFQWSEFNVCGALAPNALTLDAFVTTFTAHRQLLTALTATSSQHVSAVGGGHALTEAVLVAALAYGGLECPFHIELFLPSTGNGIRFREGKDRRTFHDYQNPNVNFFWRLPHGRIYPSNKGKAGPMLT